jgi:uncharacterized MAPEG superfamily protein
MTVGYFCVLVAAFIPLILAAYAKFSSKGYDNRSPREFLEKLQGRARRANYAQMNSFEAFPPFAAGVIIAHNAGAAQGRIDLLAVSFIFLRILYAIFYVQDQHAARSAAWFLAFACVVGLFVVSF